ncbi:hypothetical protein HY491_02790 [Candidatus Woesearchaeota archaeon]|nr:hypothetical protein [Candidatus Woesearchaeota archaeon]
MERRIDVYPFGGRPVTVTPTDTVLVVSPPLQEYITAQWKPLSQKGYKSGWLPLVTKLRFSRKKADIVAGAMTYAQTNGCVQAILNDEPCAPPRINNLSVSVIPLTSDGYVLLSRRNPALAHAGGVWNFPGGYMGSIQFDRANCDAPAYRTDPRLYDIRAQLDLRIAHQEFHGLQPEDITFINGPDRLPDALAFGTYHSFEMELGVVARFRKTRVELTEHIRRYEVEQGKPEHTEFTFIDAGDLDRLLANQASLYAEDPRTYRSSNPTRQIVLDDNIGELAGGSLQQITGTGPRTETRERLEQRLGLRIHDTTKRITYAFPERY